MPPNESREQAIARVLKRCSAETVAAATRFQDTRDPSDLAIIVHGVLSRDLPEEHANALETATDDSRLIEDLGMDSFGLFEVAMTAEEIFGISIENEEMKSLATIGQLKSFVKSKLHDAPPGPQP
jgi:acyl carrier protein